MLSRITHITGRIVHLVCVKEKNWRHLILHLAVLRDTLWECICGTWQSARVDFVTNCRWCSARNLEFDSIQRFVLQEVKFWTWTMTIHMDSWWEFFRCILFDTQIPKKNYYTFTFLSKRSWLCICCSPATRFTWPIKSPGGIFFFFFSKLGMQKAPLWGLTSQLGWHPSPHQSFAASQKFIIKN